MTRILCSWKLRKGAAFIFIPYHENVQCSIFSKLLTNLGSSWCTSRGSSWAWPSSCKPPSIFRIRCLSLSPRSRLLLISCRWGFSEQCFCSRCRPALPSRSGAARGMAVSPLQFWAMVRNCNVSVTSGVKNRMQETTVEVFDGRFSPNGWNLWPSVCIHLPRLHERMNNRKKKTILVRTVFWLVQILDQTN